MEIGEDLRKPVVLVVGIDFGTSRSGFAYSKINDTTDTIYQICRFFFQNLNQKIPRIKWNLSKNTHRHYL
jgi:RNase H-fold protein (predicted Holliday junction resolvase)